MNAHVSGKLIKLLGIARRKRYLHGFVAHGVAASVEHRSMLSLVKYATVVDIGANRGQFALAVRGQNPEARIVSFEPLQKPAQQFRALFEGDPLVTLNQVAIGPTAGDAEIHVSQRDDSSSLLPITEMQSSMFPGTAEASVSTVRVGRLREFLSEQDLQSPSLLKLDVQGFELAALQGCEDLLGRFANIYVECSFLELYKGQALAPDVIRWLQDRKFLLSGIYNVSRDDSGRTVQADLLFART